jgi:myosin-crossreactive antigen
MVGGIEGESGSREVRSGGLLTEKSGSRVHKQNVSQPDESEELALWIVAGLSGAYGEEIKKKIEERLGRRNE